MKIPFWTNWHRHEHDRELAEQRRVDAWADRLIDEYVLHQLNEDIGLPGDPPYYDVCLVVGDGHGHQSPDWPFYAGWEYRGESEAK